MKRFITIKIDPPVLDTGSTLKHHATTYEIRNKPTTIDSVVLDTSVRDTSALLVYRKELEVDPSAILYVRTRYHYIDESDIVPEGEQPTIIDDTDFTRFVSFRIDQEGYTLSDVIVMTPEVDLVHEPLMDGTVNLVFTTTPFKMYAGLGTHVSTTWTLIDTDGNTVLPQRLKDETNLTKYIINSGVLDTSKNYVMKAKHHTNTGGESLEGKTSFSLDISSIGLYDVKQIGPMVNNRTLCFKLTLYTTIFEYVDIIVKDKVDNIVLQNQKQLTTAPNIFIDNLNLYEPYSIYCRIHLKNGYTTPYRLVSINTLEDNFLVQPKDNITYLNTFDYTHEILLKGQTVQHTSELYNGAIVMTKHNTNSLYRYRLYQGKLIEVGKLGELPVPEGVTIGLPYLNVLPLHNGNLVVNFCYDNSGIDDAYSVFCTYKYNAASNKLTLLNTLVNKDELYSTSSSSSAVVGYDDNIYYVPNRMVDVEGKLKPLALYVYNTVTGVRTRLNELPFVAVENVTLSITRENELVILGGSNSDSIYMEDDYIHTERSNDNVYIYNIPTKTYRECCSLKDVPKSVYRFQACLRRDSKIILFNAVSDSFSVGDSKTIVVNPNDNTVTIDNNSLNDGLAYRNVVCTQSGDIIRISNREIDPQIVYTYISNTMVADKVDKADVELTPIKDLVIGYNEVVTIEEPWLYETIRILGNNENDTGILHWVANNETYTYNYKTLIITRSNNYTMEYINSKDYEDVVIISDTTLEIIDQAEDNVLIVPEFETRTITDPYIYSKIIIKGTDMDNTGTLIWITESETRKFYFDSIFITRDTIIPTDTDKNVITLHNKRVGYTS